MIFYVDEAMFVGVMPHGCPSRDQIDFLVQDNQEDTGHQPIIARCQMNCISCQFGKMMILEDIDEVYDRYGIQKCRPQLCCRTTIPTQP